MDFFINYIKRAIGIVIVVAASSTFLPTYVTANQQTPEGQIVQVSTDKSVYLPTGRRVVIDLDIRNPDNVARDYQAGIEIISPSGNVVFERVSTQEEDIGKITVAPTTTSTVTFLWEDKDDGARGPNRKSEAGIYTVTATLRDWNDFDLILDSKTDSDGITFEIQAKPFLEVSKESLDFGSIIPGQTPERSFNVTNSGNGTLEWSVDRWPESWLELVHPTSTTTGQDTVTFRVRPDPQLSEPFIGNIRVVSNVGEMEIPVTGSIAGRVSGRVDNIVATGLTYRQGEEITLEFEIENDGGVRLDYRAGVTIQNPEGEIAFNSLEQDGEIVISLQPGTSDSRTYTWQIPLLSPPGDYLATVSLRYLHDPNLIFHDYFDEAFVPSARQPLVSTTFTVQEGPLLALSHDSWDFGSVDVGSTAEATFDAQNTRQGTLAWEIVGLSDWLDLISPQQQTVGGGSIVVSTKDTLDAGVYDGEILVSSNGGDGTISLTLRVQELATPTPTITPTTTPRPATPTPEPAAPTPEPATPTPEPATPTPELTSTPARPTNTPAPTATLSPPTATATASPSPTSIPTSTPASQVIAAAQNPSSEDAEQEPESSGGCGSAQGHVSPPTAAANVMFLLAPLAIVVIVRILRRRK